MAKEFYGYFDSTETDERIYQSDEYTEAFRANGGTGVGWGLAVSPAGGMSVSVAPGAAMVHGYTYALIDDGGGPKTLSFSSSGSADRIDRIVLRLDVSGNGRNITMAVLEGVPAPSPVPPALTRNDLIREISFCRVHVPASAAEITPEDIVDEHLDAEVCGILAARELQYSALDARYRALATPEKEGAMSAGDKAALDTLAQALHITEDAVGLGGRRLVDMLLPFGEGEEETTIPEALLQAQEDIRYHAPLSMSCTLAASGWAGNGPYTQTVAVEGMLGTDTPLVDVILSDDAGTAVAELEAYGYVGRIDTLLGSISATCYEEKPEVDITIGWKVMR